MKLLLIVFIVVLTPISILYSQNALLTGEVHNPPIPLENTDWGTDYVVSNTEPFGRPSAVYRTTNNTIYVAVPDTNILASRSLVVLSSTNNGINWSVVNSISPGGIVIPKVKMVGRPGSDSVYCFFLYGSTVYSWNINGSSVLPFTAYTNIRDFDAAISSTNSIYLIYDLNSNNDVRFHGSANGGVTWAGAVFLSSAAALPTLNFSLTGDTAVINYKGPIAGTDTLTAAIRNVRYRESAAGTLSVVGSFTTPLAAGTVRDQFMGVRNGTNVWLFYTTGTTGSIDLNCITSNDGGTTYGAPFTIGSSPGRDEYWFDAKPYNSGVDLIFYSDSLQGGAPTNSSDKLMNCYALNTTPNTFSGLTQLSERPPTWSGRGYIPTLIEYYDANADAGVIWVGVDGANRRLFYDRYGALTHISHNSNEVPEKYSLSQNYPNPFNPTTKFNFSIPKNSFVSLKVFDVLGREVATIVEKDFSMGSYTVDFDATKLSTGIYFYTLKTGDFTETKKMMLVK